MKGKWLFHKRVPPWWRVWVLLGLVLGAAWLVAGDIVAAQESDTFTDTTSLPDIDPFTALLTRRGPSAVRLSSRAPQLYQTTAGEERFTFQVVGQHALIRFHCADAADTLECALLEGRPEEEIYLLHATRSPRGDVIYKDYDGHAVLRVTATGGATLYDLEHANVLAESAAFTGTVDGGRAVLPVSGNAARLEPPLMAGDQVQSRLQRLSELMAIRHALLVTFRAEGAKPEDKAVLADAALTAAKAIDVVAADELGARAIEERLRAVVVAPGEVAGYSFENAELTIYYDSAMGVSGRPSSATISRYLESVL